MGGENYDIAAIELKVQQVVFPRRLRIKEFFRDYDPRRSWRCTKSQFVRALDYAGIKITHGEASALADSYIDEASGDVHYGNFSESIDQCFGPKHLESQPTIEVPEPGSTLPPLFKPNDMPNADINEMLEYVLARIALLCKTRGIIFKKCFVDFDQINTGCVTEQQFRRCFPFFEFRDEELTCMIEHYSERGRTALNGVNYRALHEDISDRNPSNSDPPYPRSDLVIRPDGSQWTDGDYTAEEKVQARVVERRLRLREPFTDHDPLRKGYATVGQARSILDSMQIKVTQADWEALVAKYTRDDGMFHYAKFCDAVDEAFTVKGLETSPLTRVSMPDASTTLPARENVQKLSEADIYEIERVEEDIRAKVMQRRIFLKPMFQDFDPTRSGHVTKNQFARALGTLGFELTEDEVTLLSMKYCDLGNKFDVNYYRFVDCCDPNLDILHVQKEDRRMNLKPDNSYFERTYDNGVPEGPAAIGGRCHTVISQERSGMVVEGQKKNRDHLKLLSSN